jgi:hypothetical protein
MNNVRSSVIRLLGLTLATGLALAGCATDEPAQSTAEAQAITVVCTPGQQTCDYGCYYAGLPSTDDCIIQCNAAGNGWINLTDCGYAQNWPTSASCLNSQPYPICQNN